MRHPLSNPDIARCVIAEVESNQTLTTLARVSPVLSEPALDRLWHTIPSVVLLARTMPGQYWVEEAFKHDQKPNPYDVYWYHARQLSFTEEERQGDWLGERFRLYAARVRSLSTKYLEKEMLGPRHTKGLRGLMVTSTMIGYEDHTCTTWIHPDIFQAWDSYNREFLPLFPNLKHAHLAVASFLDNDTNSAALFLTAALTCLSLSGPHGARYSTPDIIIDEKVPITLLQSVQVRFPLLDSLDLGDARLGPILSKAMESMVLQVPRLRVFRCSAIVSCNFIADIAALPLEVLQASLPQGFLDVTLPDGFSLLKQLQIGGPSLDIIGHLVSSIKSSHVEVMKLQAITKVTGHQITNFLGIVAAHPSALSLRTLVFQSSTWNDDRLSFNDIQPILRLSNLSYIDLTDVAIIWSLGNMHSILQALPELETLRSFGFEHMDLLEFIDVTRNHRRLKHIPVEISCSVHSASSSAYGVVFSQLEHIRINVADYHPSKTDRTFLARYLAMTFPVLSKVYVRVLGDNKLLSSMEKYQLEAKLAKEQFLNDHDSSEKAASRSYAKRGKQVLASMLGLTSSTSTTQR